MAEAFGSALVTLGLKSGAKEREDLGWGHLGRSRHALACLEVGQRYGIGLSML